MFDVVKKPIEGAQKDGIWGFGTGREKWKKGCKKLSATPPPVQRLKLVILNPTCKNCHSLIVPTKTVNNLFNHGLLVDYLP